MAGLRCKVTHSIFISLSQDIKNNRLFLIVLALGTFFRFEFEVYEKLDKISKDETHQLREFINTTLDSNANVAGGCPLSQLINAAELLIKSMDTLEMTIMFDLQNNPGWALRADSRLLEGQESDDEYLLKTIND